MTRARADSDALRPGALARPLGLGEFIVGFVLPAVCLILDPLVFRTSDLALALGPEPMFPHLRAAGWLFVVLQGAALLAYGTLRVRAPTWHAALAGFLLVGALGALVVGAMLAPLALAGTFFFGFGLLGFVPLFTCVVYLRRAVRGVRRSQVWRQSGAAFSLLLGMGLALGLPAITWYIGAHEMRVAIGTLERGEPVAVLESTERLKRVRWLVTMDDVVAAWRRAGDPGVRRRLARTYTAVTGDSIEERASELFRPRD